MSAKRVGARSGVIVHRVARLPRGGHDFARQLALWFGFVIAYQVTRGLADRGAAEAFRNGRRVLRLEDRLDALFEPDLQGWALGTSRLLVDIANWTYWISQLAVVLVALVWIYLYRVDSYTRVRDTFIVTNTVGLLFYIALPTAPPRLFPHLGFVDTVAGAALSNGTRVVELLANPYAAMPSLHAADALIIGVALAVLVRSRLLKALCVLWPGWVAFSLMATANHSWLDIVAGMTLAGLGAAIAVRLGRQRGPTRSSRGSTIGAGPDAGDRGAGDDLGEAEANDGRRAACSKELTAAR